MFKFFIFLVALFVLLLGGIYYEIRLEDSKGACFFDVEMSTIEVKEFLVKKHLPIEYLSQPLANYNLCALEFKYSSVSDSYDFVVTSSRLFGVKVMSMKND